MTPDDIRTLEDGLAQVSLQSRTAARLFATRLTELAPHAEPFFTGDAAERAQFLTQLLTASVDGVKRHGEPSTSLDRAWPKSTSADPDERDLAQIATALLWTLEQTLREHLDERTRRAWSMAYRLWAADIHYWSSELFSLSDAMLPDGRPQQLS